MKSLETFKFKVASEYEQPAIWLTLHEREVAIYPFALYELFWDCYKRRRISQGVEARFQIFKEEVDGYYHDDAYGSYHIEYNRDTFLDSAIQALRDLCNHVIGEGVKVTVRPDAFTKWPMIFGWCEGRQLLRSLYLGLLEFTLC